MVVLKRFLIPISLSLTLIGCCFPNREISLALQDSWKNLRPATEYGIMNNPTLDADSKATRMRLVNEFGLLIDEMVRSTEEKNPEEVR